jgi:hypothetical protein
VFFAGNEISARSAHNGDKADSNFAIAAMLWSLLVLM